jgi:hypothetical protein
MLVSALLVTRVGSLDASVGAVFVGDFGTSGLATIAVAAFDTGLPLPAADSFDFLAAAIRITATIHINWKSGSSPPTK